MLLFSSPISNVTVRSRMISVMRILYHLFLDHLNSWSDLGWGNCSSWNGQRILYCHMLQQVIRNGSENCFSRFSWIAIVSRKWFTLQHSMGFSLNTSRSTAYKAEAWTVSLNWILRGQVHQIKNLSRVVRSPVDMLGEDLFQGGEGLLQLLLLHQGNLCFCYLPLTPFDLKRKVVSKI